MSKYSRIIFQLFFLLSFGQLLGQSSYTGTVFDETDQSPLIGVNLLLKGKAIGTTTDVDGTFEIIH